jgi:hypothetical protein
LTATPPTVAEGSRVVFTLSLPPSDLVLYGTSPLNYTWQVAFGTFTVSQNAITPDPNNPANFIWDTAGAQPGIYNASVIVRDSSPKPQRVVVPDPSDTPIQVTVVKPTLTATPSAVAEGSPVVFTLWPSPSDVYGTLPLTFTWQVAFGPYAVSQDAIIQDPNNPANFTWDTSGVQPGIYNASVQITDSSPKPRTVVVPDRSDTPTQVTVNLRPVSSGDTIPVTMRRAAEPPTSDAALWVAIRASANQLSFQNYVQFVDTIMCPPPSVFGRGASGQTTIDYVLSLYFNSNPPPCLPPLDQRRFLPFPNTDAYRLLKVATESFLMLNCGIYLDTGTLSQLVNSPPSPPLLKKPVPGQPFPIPGYDPSDDANRLNQSPTGLPDAIINWWKIYLASGNQYLNLNDPRSAFNHIIPYLALVRSRLSDLPLTDFCSMGFECYGILQQKLTNPCLIELIWSYWHEEAMLVQTVNAISRRFQNFRGAGLRDPLERFDIDPLRRLNSLLWGYIQDEQHRLTVVRRAYEYNHEYGLTLEGKALKALRPSDSRSKFLEAFHNLLYLCTIFYKEDDDTTVVADGFPVLNALKEVHYILAAGAHNQFGELPSTARQEMLMQQWLLARPEMREFLGGKIMVPYPEEWMDRVDNVKGMEGWTDVSVIHFHDLAVYGEQVVLSVRYGNWSVPATTAAQAANWARYWRNEIQGYIHAYRAATGVDLSTDVTDRQDAARRYTVPSVLLRQRLATQIPRR